MKKFNWIFTNYTASGQVPLLPNAGTITFYNSGNDIAVINDGIRLNPGNSVTLPANENELDATQYYFRFDDSFVVGGAARPSLTIIQKVFAR